MGKAEIIIYREEQNNTDFQIEVRVEDDTVWLTQMQMAEFFKTAGLWRKDLASGQQGFTMAALLLFGKPETIGSALPHY